MVGNAHPTKIALLQLVQDVRRCLHFKEAAAHRNAFPRRAWSRENERRLLRVKGLTLS